MHARPEYQVRGELEYLDKLAREILHVERGPEIAGLALQWRDDLDKLARETVPGFTDAARAAEYAASKRREEEDQERKQLTSHGEQTTERGDIAEDPDD